MTGYVPYGARSLDEYAIREEFLNVNGRGVLLMALILAKDNGTVLRKEILDEALEVTFSHLLYSPRNFWSKFYGLKYFFLKSFSKKCFGMLPKNLTLRCAE